MDESKLRYFVSVARNKSFSKAALELHVVQSTVSRQIALLEEQLGVQLFFRDTHQVRLTPAGERLLRNSFSYLTQYDHINENVRNLLHREERRFHVVCGPLEQPLLAKAVRIFKEAVPDLEMHTVMSPYHRHGQYIQSGSTRLFFTVAPCLELLPGCQHLSLGKYRWKAVARRDSGFWTLPPEKQAVLQGQQLIRFPPEYLYPAQEFLNKLPLENTGTSRAVSFSISCVQAMIGGVVLMPEYLESWLNPELRMEQVFPEPLVVESVLVLNPREATPLERQFFECIRDNFQP